VSPPRTAVVAARAAKSLRMGECLLGRESGCDGDVAEVTAGHPRFVERSDVHSQESLAVG
jgi:hypothetical protein